MAYAGRGLSLDTEGVNRRVNIAYATLAERRAANPLTPDDPDLLPGQTGVSTEYELVTKLQQLKLTKTP